MCMTAFAPAERMYEIRSQVLTEDVFIMPGVNGIMSAPDLITMDVQRECGLGFSDANLSLMKTLQKKHPSFVTYITAQ